MALLAGLALPGAAAAEPRLFQGSVVLGGPPLTITNPGRIASVQGSDPASFQIAASLLGGSATLMFTYMGFPVTNVFSFMNEAGSFGSQGGPGTAVFSPLPRVPGFRASVSGGARRFGGTQRLLGSFVTKFGTLQTGILPLTPIGGSFGESQATGPHGGTAGFFTTTIWGFPWTTGAVTAMATTPMGAPLTATAQGSDQRTPGGLGTIQLVTPLLVSQRLNSDPFSRSGSIATLTLHFVPEPAVNLLFLGGIAGLALLSRFARRG